MQNQIFENCVGLWASQKGMEVILLLKINQYWASMTQVRDEAAWPLVMYSIK